MSNIEDDLYEIKKLKIFLIFYKTHGWIPNIDRTIDVEKSIQCIENILSDYTRQKQINEEHQKINGELREKVKELEENNKTQIMSPYYVKENYIPKQVVIDKIEENKQILDKTNDGNLRERLYIENGIMKELLGGKSK